MKKTTAIEKFLRTSPSISEIIDFVEKEAQRRVKEIQDIEAYNKKLRYIQFSKNMMEEQGTFIQKWANEKDANPDFVNLCKEIIDASKKEIP